MTHWKISHSIVFRNETLLRNYLIPLSRVTFASVTRNEWFALTQNQTVIWQFKAASISPISLIDQKLINKRLLVTWFTSFLFDFNNTLSKFCRTVWLDRFDTMRNWILHIRVVNFVKYFCTTLFSSQHKKVI